MSYTLEQFAADCRAALLKIPAPRAVNWCVNTRPRQAPTPTSWPSISAPMRISDRKIFTRILICTSASCPRLSRSEEQPAARPRTELGRL